MSSGTRGISAARDAWGALKRVSRRDVRPAALAFLLLFVVAIGGVVQLMPGKGIRAGIQVEPVVQEAVHELAAFEPSPAGIPDVAGSLESEAPGLVDPREYPEEHARQARKREAQLRFDQALMMIHAGRFEESIVALSRVQELVPDSPDVYVNLGYSLLGLDEFESANRAFDRAIDLNPAQANAYYGMAIGFEGLGELEAALGGMRSFLHLSQDRKLTQIHVARAKSAIWEWESKLGRGPWGPTKGIPPGFTAEELLRDGNGVSVKMPIPGTQDENGMFQYEIKDQDKFEIFDP